MPIFGYSEQDLNCAHKRGVSRGRADCARALLDELDQVTNLGHYTKGMPYPTFSDVVRGLAGAWQRAQSERDRQKEKTLSWQRSYAKLRDELETVESSRLYATVDNLTAERDLLRREVSTLRNELAQLQSTHQSEAQKLKDEVTQLDKLVVEYECKMRDKST